MTSWGRALHGKALRCDGRRDINISFLISALFSRIYINGSGGKFKWYLKKTHAIHEIAFPRHDARRRPAKTPTGLRNPP
jgi:hypothetical protein